MLLDPPRGAAILDMCAAPGMKTSHLASILKNKGTVYAVEKDTTRYQRLCQLMRTSKSNAVHPLNSDSLALRSDSVPGVQYILVDPSCSGSGMTSRLFGTDELNLAERLVSLSAYQAKILQHAMREFPDAQRIVYSTCSVYEEENEQVVHRSLEACPEWELIKPIPFADKWRNFGSPKWKHVGKKCIYARADADLTDGFFVALFQRRPEAGVDNYHRAAGNAAQTPAAQEEYGDGEEEMGGANNSEWYENPFGNGNGYDQEQKWWNSNKDAWIDNGAVSEQKNNAEPTKQKKPKPSILSEPAVERAEAQIEIANTVEKVKKKKHSFENNEEVPIAPTTETADESVETKKKRKHKNTEQEIVSEANTATQVPVVSEEPTKEKKKKKKRSTDEEDAAAALEVATTVTTTKKSKKRRTEDEARTVDAVDAEISEAPKKSKKKKHTAEGEEEPTQSAVGAPSLDEPTTSKPNKNKKRSLDGEAAVGVEEEVSVKKSKKHKKSKE